MKTVKFRIWNGMDMVYDITAGKFGTFYVNPEKGDGLNPKDTASLTVNTTKYPDNTPLMQFIGLTDKNGKEIYEGDVVRILYTNWESKSGSDKRTLQQYLIDIATIGVIVFNEDRFCVKTESKNYNNLNYSSIFPGQHGYIEVIGNIYENSELITT